MSIPAHNSYLPSGYRWLGDFPAAWQVRPLWTLFRRVKRTGHPQEKLLSVYRDHGVVPKDSRDDNFNKPSDDLSTYQLVRPGDLAINKMKAWQGSVAISEFQGIVSPAYFVFEAIHQEVPKFLHYLLRSKEYIAGYLSISKGIRPNQWDLEPQEHSRMPVLLPSRPEQIAIAAFLDREIAKIDALVEEQKRLIDLLKEKRQAVISRAVTKGLNPAAKMKDSEVEWLGKVPEHWRVAPLKFMASLQSGGTPSKANEDYWNGTVPWASAKDLKSDRLFATTELITETALTEGAASLVPAGSVIVLVRGMMLARAFPVSVAAVPMAINQDLKALRGTGIENDFLAWALRGLEAETLSRLDEAGHGTKALRMDAWTSMLIPVPPLDEQRQINEFIEVEISRIDGLIEDVERAIVLLQERRSATISAAVTGKIDVREISNQILERPLDRDTVRSTVASAVITRFSHRQNFGRVKLQKFLYLAETYADITEMAGSYDREAAGPLDRAMLSETEAELQRAGTVLVEQPDGRGGQVIYKVLRRENQDTDSLGALLGDRKRKFDHLLNELGDLDTKTVEAVTTLFAVWNDFLIDGHMPTDDAIVSGVLNDWHPEKRGKFIADELRTRLGWMRRRDIVPSGHGPRTSTGRLFA